MGWSIGYDKNWSRDIGYGVPAYCDHPGCNADIDRGLSYVCGGEPYGGDYGCGLYFCGAHLWHASARREHKQLCKRCLASKPAYRAIKPEHPDWMRWKVEHESWADWRAENPGLLASYKHCLAGDDAAGSKDLSRASATETGRSE